MSLTAAARLTRHLRELELDVESRPAGRSTADLVHRAQDIRWVARELGLDSIAAAAALREGEALLHGGDPAAALAPLQTSVGELRGSTSVALLASGLARLAEALAATGDLPRALEACAEGIDLVERHRYDVSPPYLQASYLRRAIGLYTTGVRVAHMRNDARMLRWIEWSKSRVLPLAAGTGGEGGAEAAELADRLVEASDELRRVRAEVPERELDALLQRRRVLYDRFVALTRPAASGVREFDLARVRASLAPGQRVLSYYWTDRRDLLITVIDRDGADTVSQSVSATDREALDGFVRRVLGARGAAEPSEGGKPPATADELDEAYVDGVLGRLSDVLLPQPVRTRLAGAARLLVSPHRSLHMIPFSALPVNGKPLVRTVAVATVPNLTCLQLPPPPPAPAPGRVLAAGVVDYAVPGFRASRLPLVEPEIEDVRRLYAADGVGVEALLDAQVDARGLSGRMTGGSPAPTCLHLATHGMSVPADTPLESFLLLGSTRLDGIDLARWRLPGASVVLSACCSGQRAVMARGMAELPGDDMLGLPAAFFAAGAQQVLGALWPVVGNVARPLTVGFHRALLDGQPGDVALQTAVTSYLDRALYWDRAKYWGPFFLSCLGHPISWRTAP